MPVATAYIPNIYNIYIPIYSSILRVRYVVAMNSYRIKILLKYLCGYYENNENILQYTTVYSQNTTFSTTWSYGKEGNILINILYLFFVSGLLRIITYSLPKIIAVFFFNISSALEEIWWSTALNFAGWSINWYSIIHKLDSKIANSDLLGGVKFSVLQQISSMAYTKAIDLLHNIQGIMELIQGGWSLKTYFIGKILFMLLLQTNNWTIS